MGLMHGLVEIVGSSRDLAAVVIITGGSFLELYYYGPQNPILIIEAPIFGIQQRCEYYTLLRSHLLSRLGPSGIGRLGRETCVLRVSLLRGRLARQEPGLAMGRGFLREASSCTCAIL